MNWAEFFHMGGYADYVWGSYTAAAVILLVNAVLPILRKKQILRMTQELAQLKSGKQR